MTVTIPLTQGKVAVIDDADAAQVATHHWWAVRHGSRYYAATKVRLPSGQRRVLQMQRFLLLPRVGIEVDHINGDSLDNRRANLRLATRAQNKINAGPPANNRSGFKGVSQRRPYLRWRAEIRYERRLIFLGYFASPEAAARAYDAKARELHGPFARLNFPEP